MNEVKKDDVSQLKSLGSGGTKYAYDGDINPNLLETFPNKFPGSKYWIRFVTSEFSSLCPRTGQADWATMTISYIPDKLCVESKSLKLYVGSYRNAKSFMETITGNFLRHLVDLLSPHRMIVVGSFAARGGITTEVVAEYSRDTGYAVQKDMVEYLPCC